MGIPKERRHTLSCVLVEGKFHQGFVGDLDEGFGWPGHEPNHCGVVDQARVHTAVVTQVVARLAHQEHYVEVVLDYREERLEKEFVLQSLGLPWVSHSSTKHSSHFIFDCAVILLAEQIGNLPNGQYGIDILH